MPTSIDPCQLISPAEAGQLAGATFGPGLEKTSAGNGRICVYGANTKNVFEVDVAVAPDLATAKKDEAEYVATLKAQAAKAQFPVLATPLPGLVPGVDAMILRVNIAPMAVDVIDAYAIKGTVFFGFNDLVQGGSAPSVSAAKAELLKLVGRLP